jgi:hypothetical protein
VTLPHQEKATALGASVNIKESHQCNITAGT